MLKTPIVFVVFNRPDTTIQVFERIRQARPSQLLIIADGPRVDRPGEMELCAATRKIVEQIDWPCEVLHNYSETNMGCRKRLASGLNWVFSTVEEAIVLEDDCLPHPSFFRYCDEMLERYRFDHRIAHISGVNFQSGHRRTEHSYYFSRYNHIWGWASWRRAWQHYDPDLNLWPSVRDGGWLSDLLVDQQLVNYWTKVFDRVHGGDFDTWDYQWLLACWLQNGLSIIPAVNLVTNIGFGADSTHTSENNPTSNIPAQELAFPINSPPFMVRDTLSDGTSEKLYLPPPRFIRRYRRIKRDLGKLVAFFNK